MNKIPNKMLVFDLLTNPRVKDYKRMFLLIQMTRSEKKLKIA